MNRGPILSHEALTLEAIETLQQEAARHGDDAVVDICDRAKAGSVPSRRTVCVIIERALRIR